MGDIAGQHDYTNFREPAYLNADIFILTYSSISKDSFENVKSYWVPEIEKYKKSQENPDNIPSEKPIVLVSTKIDLRQETSTTHADGSVSESSNLVSYKSGERLKQEIGAKCFIECSSLTQENVKAVFDNAVLT